jgi:hypothetical protein
MDVDCVASLESGVLDAAGFIESRHVIHGPTKRRAISAEPKLPAPCVGCKNEARCKDENIACDCLAVYLSVGASAARYAVAPRQPSAAIRERIEAFRLKRKTALPPYRRPAVDEDEAD